MSWQPIETAPKDFYTEIDLFANGLRVTDCVWGHPDEAEKNEYDWTVSVYESGFGYVSHRVLNATHWMEIPQPPNDEKEKNEQAI